MEVGGLRFDGPFFQLGSVLNEPGIYLIMHRNLVLDVGESQALVERLGNHDRRGCWIHKGGLDYSMYVHYMPGSSEQQRRYIESRLRFLLDPVCGER